MFQRKSLSSFHESSRTSLLCYCLCLLCSFCFYTSAQLNVSPPCLHISSIFLSGWLFFFFPSSSSSSCLSFSPLLRLPLRSSPICMSVFWLCGRHPVRTCCVCVRVCMPQQIHHFPFALPVRDYADVCVWVTRISVLCAFSLIILVIFLFCQCSFVSKVFFFCVYRVYLYHISGCCVLKMSTSLQYVFSCIFLCLRCIWLEKSNSFLKRSILFSLDMKEKVRNKVSRFDRLLSQSSLWFYYA